MTAPVPWMVGADSRSRALNHPRQIIETVDGQLTEQFSLGLRVYLNRVPGALDCLQIKALSSHDSKPYSVDRPFAKSESCTPVGRDACPWPAGGITVPPH